MSGSSEPLGETDDGAAERRLGGLSKIEEELRFHLELMTEKLCAEGFDRTDAEAEARLLALAHTGVLHREGPLAAYRVAPHLRGAARRLLLERGFIS